MVAEFAAFAYGRPYGYLSAGALRYRTASIEGKDIKSAVKNTISNYLKGEKE